ncbi:MAG: BatA and WFA domain-containing protein, partial [Planctomycetes bacterium]|nr:BatA and WFA domain-containing protein [Planctomycetota bacterium]
MTTSLGFLATLLGLAAIAGVFFLLHRLRVRHRLVVVDTTMFWKQAIEDARARVLVQRFRHPWVYALLLTIGGLLWLAFAGLDVSARSSRDTLVLLDASATMTRGDRFASACELAEELVPSLGVERRHVILCDERPRTVLAPGEHARLLHERLVGREARGIPPTVERALRSWLGRKRERPCDVVVIGDAMPASEVVAALPSDVRLSRVDVSTSSASASTRRSNQGITAFGYAAAQSGSWDRVDVLAEVTRSGEGEISPPVLTLDGRALGRAFERRGEERSSGRGGARCVSFYLQDLACNGESLEARLPGGDSLEADDRATLVLPDRRKVRVAVEPDLPPAIARAIAVDPALEIVGPSAVPAVVIRRAGGDYAGEIPALELTGGTSEHAFFVT